MPKLEDLEPLLKDKTFKEKLEFLGKVRREKDLDLLEEFVHREIERFFEANKQDYAEEYFQYRTVIKTGCDKCHGKGTISSTVPGGLTGESGCDKCKGNGVLQVVQIREDLQ